MKLKIGLFAASVILVAVILVLLTPIERNRQKYEKWGRWAVLAETDSRAEYIIEHEDDYPKELLQIYSEETDELKESMLNFIYNYPFHKDDYDTMSFTEDELNCDEIPALYMDDFRWGYEKINGGYIRNDGCATVSLTMAALYLNHNSDIDPVKIADYINENNMAGLFGGINARDLPSVLENFGFKFVEHNYDEDEGGSGVVTEEELKASLDKENTVILVTMFGETFGGHAIIIRGYDENGFYINDPASPMKTAQVWDFEVFENELMRYFEICK